MRRVSGALLAALVTAACHEAAVAADERELTMRPIAEGVYVHEGLQEDVSTTNRGDVANIGFIVGGTCVAVIDTGATLAIGEALRRAVRRATALPVCFVINTHVHPDHVLGNAAFAADHPQFVGHARLPAALAARGGNQLRAMQRDLGEFAAGSAIVAPTLVVETERTIDLGDRPLRLHAARSAHTDNDLTVVDEKTDTWWLSDLLFVGHVPVVDGSLRGWLAVLDAWTTVRPPAHVIPGHGPVDAPFAQSLAAERGYLESLQAGVRRALQERRTMQQAVDSVGTDQRRDWLLFDTFHRRNVTAAYAEYEWED